MRTWFRWYEGTTDDSKLRWVASKAGVSLPVVIAIWVRLLERASESDTRGSILGFDTESTDVSYGLDDGTTDAVLTAFEEKGLIQDDMVVSWEKRQSQSAKRAGSSGTPSAAKSSTERSRAYRERQKNATQRQCNGCNAQDNIREEEKR